MVNSIGLIISVFLLFAFVEWYFTHRLGKKLHSPQNTVMNLAIGAIDQLFGLIGFVLFFLVLDYVYKNYRLFTLENTWLQWVLAYIAVDFVSYWYHRFSHEVNVLWAGHITHHSSDHFNYTNGFRVSPFQTLNRIAFWIILPLVGFSPLVLILTFKISGVYDFFLHTQHIPKLGFLEKILITPSMHRVHHGKNDIYVDKNYGSTFVIWDKLFGTYQEETETVQYGVKNADYVDDSPVRAILFHYTYLWKMMKLTSKWQDKIKLLLMPTDWKPKDINLKVQQTGQKNKVPVTNMHRHYAFMQLYCCAAGIILVLTFQDLLPITHFLLIAITSIIGLINATIIFNNNIPSNFKNQELVRLITTLFIGAVMFLVNSKMYLVVMLGFLLISVIYTSYLSTSPVKFTAGRNNVPEKQML